MGEGQKGLRDEGVKGLKGKKVMGIFKLSDGEDRGYDFGLYGP